MRNAELGKESIDLTEIFKQLDIDGNQKLAPEELKFGLEKSGIKMNDNEFKAMFNRLDTNKNGSISYSEYLAGACDLCILNSEKYLMEAFHFFDKDDKGYLTKSEIRDCFSRGWIQEETLNELFEEVDRNYDGYISFKEFCAMMNKVADKKKNASESEII